MSKLYPTRHPRQFTDLRKRYKFQNEIIVEISWHTSWECDFIEVFYPPSGAHKHYVRQRETIRDLFQKIRVDIAIMINPEVETVIRRVVGDSKSKKIPLGYEFPTYIDEDWTQ